MKPARSLTLPTVGLPADAPREHFGLVCDGYLAAPADGLYTLKLRSEDGSELWLDGERAIVDETIDFIGRSADVALKAGLHPLSLRYFQRDFVAGFELKVQAPAQPLAPVPAGWLSHRR